MPDSYQLSVLKLLISKCSLYEGAKELRVMSVSVHPYISGVPYRIKYFEASYDYMLKKEGVWFLTAEEIYDWFTKQSSYKIIRENLNVKLTKTITWGEVTHTCHALS